MRRSSVDDRGELAKWLRSGYGQKPVRVIAQMIAHELLTSARQSHPPIDLTPLLSVRHIKAIHRIKEGQQRPMAQGGRLRVTSDGFVVDLRAGPQTRERFTVAHELGHTIFYDLEFSPPRRTLRAESLADEETFCNILASEILMPEDTVRAELGNRPALKHQFSPTSTLLWLARRFKVSPEAMARRLTEDLGIFDGIALGCRWSEAPASPLTSRLSSGDWRLSWWAASDSVLEALYLPPVGRRPKVRLGEIEQGYLLGADMQVSLDLTRIRLGNLTKILRERDKDTKCVELWVHAVRPQGVQLDAHADTPQTVDDPDLLVRQHSEVVLFFAVRPALG